MKRDNLLLVLWVSFLIAWLYAEVTERKIREDKWFEVTEFMQRTIPCVDHNVSLEEVAILEARIASLEKRLESDADGSK